MSVIGRNAAQVAAQIALVSFCSADGRHVGFRALGTWKTHVVVPVVAFVMCVHGAFALRAAERSAAAGGGLLGADGLIPFGLGTVLGIKAATSLWLARPVERARE